MKAILIGVSALYIVCLGGVAVAGDVAAGKGKYSMCAGCHGPTGAGLAAAGYPALAGKDAATVTDLLNAYKSGARDNATMKAMASGLSDADIANLAAYIATLK